MKTITLSDDAARLLLVLLSANRDVIHAMIHHNFSPRGVVPDAQDLRMADELKLTSEMIKMLESK